MIDLEISNPITCVKVVWNDHGVMVSGLLDRVGGLFVYATTGRKPDCQNESSGIKHHPNSGEWFKGCPFLDNTVRHNCRRADWTNRSVRWQGEQLTRPKSWQNETFGRVNNVHLVVGDYLSLSTLAPHYWGVSDWHGRFTVRDWGYSKSEYPSITRLRG